MKYWQSITQLCTVFEKNKLVKQIEELEAQEQDSNNYTDSSKLRSIGVKKRQLTNIVDQINSVDNGVSYFKEIYDTFSEEEISALGNVTQELEGLLSQVNNLYLQTLYSGKWDALDCLLDIHSGAGGEEAQDWAEMLSRMYIRYGEMHNYDVEIVDKLAGDGAGVKSVCIKFSGTNAYGNLINEKGVHRLVRISPFDANKRRHTSFASVDVSPIIEEDNSIVIKPEELKIDTYRSGGAGGQHVNKTESAVRITHIPTGIVVQCQNERSQLQNKEFALKVLKSKLLELKIEKEEEEKAKAKSSDKKIEWGSQIRSYVLHPYNMVKDHRTNYQTSNTTAVLDGDIQEFITQNLILKGKNK